MAHRQLYLKNSSKLSLFNDQMVLVKENGEKLSFPLEDFDLIFVENPNTVITANLISRMTDLGCSMVLCGKNYLPSSQILPFNSYYLQSEVLNLQLQLLPSKKKKLWETIVRQKIKNQLSVLESVSANTIVIDQLKKCIQQIKPGDESNMEGLAARIYFQALFGKDFIRFSDSLISIGLNYGYSIIASQIIRTVACNGLLDNLGIWHASKQNNNNLSYDFIEPYRQLVDYKIYKSLENLSNPLSHDVKMNLINLLNENIEIDGYSYKTSYAIEMTIKSYLLYMKTGNIKDIKLPKLRLLEKNDEAEL